MGLAGPRKRRKIGEDPNNTAWANGKGFGRSQLLSQGWTPGKGLGRTGDSYGDGQPRGSANLVKAVFREDNLGLGAKIGSQRDNNHGLEILQGVLGRLNGKSSEALEKEEKALRDVKCALYAEQRWGSLRFVRGGVLTGKTTLEVTSTPLDELTNAPDEEDGSSPASGSESTPTAEAADRKALRRKEKKEKKERKEKKQKRSRKQQRADAEDHTDPGTQDEASVKAAKKERKRQKALERQNVATESESTSEKEAVVKTEATPRSSGSNTPSSRFHVRQRYIQHKRMAMMDPKALSEILMGQS